MSSAIPENDVMQRWTRLVEACPEDRLDLIELRGDTLAAYVNHVAHEARNAPIWRLNLDPKDFRNKVVEADRRRRSLHDGSVTALQGLNRMAVSLGLQPLFAGDDGDRYEVAGFAEAFVRTCYAHGRSSVAEARTKAHRPQGVAPEEPTTSNDGPEL